MSPPTASRAAPAAATNDPAARRTARAGNDGVLPKALKRLRDVEWDVVIRHLVQAAEDGLSKDEAVEAVAIVLDGLIDFRERVGGRLGRRLERADRELFRRALSLAWDLSVPTPDASGA